MSFIKLKKDERQNMVEVLASDNELRQNLIEGYLKRMPDIQKIEWRFIKKKANLQDCYKVYCAIQILPRLIETLIKHESDGKNSYLLRDLFRNPLSVRMFFFMLD